MVKKETKRSAKGGDHAVQFRGTGRRKTATARVILIPQTGNTDILINGRDLKLYTGGRPQLRTKIFAPFLATGTLNTFKLVAKVSGGGVASQIGAVSHGLARALIESNEALRPVLSKAGMLTRDPRAKERKKYGHKRARKRFQYSKR